MVIYVFETSSLHCHAVWLYRLFSFNFKTLKVKGWIRSGWKCRVKCTLSFFLNKNSNFSGLQFCIISKMDSIYQTSNFTFLSVGIKFWISKFKCCLKDPIKLHLHCCDRHHIRAAWLSSLLNFSRKFSILFWGPRLLWSLRFSKWRRKKVVFMFFVSKCNSGYLIIYDLILNSLLIQYRLVIRFHQIHYSESQ